MMSKTMKYAGLDLGTIEATFNILGGIEGAARLRRGELVLVEAPRSPEPVIVESSPNCIIRVNRSVKPIYPDWVEGLEHPELECLGPAKYNLETRVEQWLAENQSIGLVSGYRIHKQLKEENRLSSCLNLQDGLAIQSKGVVVFNRIFVCRRVFLWGSIVRRRSEGFLFVPYLYDNGDEVGLFWRWLSETWNHYEPALCSKKTR